MEQFYLNYFLTCQDEQKVVSRDEVEPDLPPPPPPPRPYLNDSKPNGQPGPCLEPEATSREQLLDGAPASQDHNMDENSGV